ncbi:hypothetical protein OF83DRAFT_1172988 [Amylostereum chailletii]|nr:hypothetical protein OF83DRAFT_1172988 [Amylostereum chailletii]
MARSESSSSSSRASRRVLRNRLPRSASSSSSTRAVDPRHDYLTLEERDLLCLWAQKHGLSPTPTQKMFLALKMTKINHMKYSKIHNWFSNERKPRNDGRFLKVKGQYTDAPGDDVLLEVVSQEAILADCVTMRSNAEGVVLLLRYRVKQWRQMWSIERTTNPLHLLADVAADAILSQTKPTSTTIGVAAFSGLCAVQ